jgi:RNA-directed DNA polymerase
VTTNHRRYSLRWLARALNTSIEQLKHVACNADSHYRPFSLDKRVIDKPIGALADIQKRIKIALLQRFQFPDSFHGGIRGHSPHTNASLHLNKKCVVKIDLRKHFPMVSSARVYRIWTEYFGFGPKIAALLTRLTTYKGHLPQGTRTSSHLANLALLEVEPQVAEIAQRLGLDYTFFVDDITLSGDRAREALGLVITVMRNASFLVGRKKIAVMGANEAQVVTGLCVNRKQGPTVPRAEIDNIRCAIREWRINVRQGEPSEKLELSIRGRIAHVRRTNPGAASRLEKQLRFSGPTP